MTTQSKRRQPLTEDRALHFDLSGSPSGVEHTLHLGGRRFTLKTHDDASRAMHRQQIPLLNHVPDHRLTHYAENVTARSGAIQSYYVNHPPSVGEFPVLSMMGILVPKSVARWAHQHHGLQKGLYSSKIRRLGLGELVTGSAPPPPLPATAKVAMKAAPDGSPSLVSISVGPENSRNGSIVGQGENLQFNATGTYSDGSTQDLTTSAAWSSSDTSLATVSAGLASASASTLGTLSITATSGSVSGSATLTVVPAWLTSGDLSSFQDLGDAAQSAVYHHPELLTLTSDPTQPSGSATALTILAAIENAPHFQVFDSGGKLTSGLVWALEQQGAAQNLEGYYKKGLQGWANAHLLDVKKGQPFTFGDKWPQASSGQQKKGWAYVYTTPKDVQSPMPDTTSAMLPVIQQALLAVRNMEELDGISYQINFGTNSISANQPPAPATSKRATGRRKLAVRAAAALGDNSGYQYTLTDSDFTCGREVSIHEVTPANGGNTGPTVTFTVTNSYFRHLGVYVRCLDSNNNPIDVTSIPNYTSSGVDTQYDWYLAWVEPANRILGVPTGNAESDELSVTLPLNAESLLIQCAGLGSLFLPVVQSNVNYPGPMKNIGEFFPSVAVPGALMTAVVDLAIPAFFLLWGIDSDELELSEPQKLIKNFVTSLVEIAAKGVFAAVFGMMSGSEGASMLPGWGMDVLTIILSEAPAQIAELLAWAAVESAADQLAESLPIVGQILEAAAAITTAIAITETVVETLMSNWDVVDTLIVTQSVTVQVSKDPNDYQYPATATQIQFVLKPGSGTPITYEASLSSLYPSYPTVSTDPIQYTFPIVPIGCQIEIDVTLTAPASGNTGDWVAATGKVVAQPGGPPSPTLSITLTEKPVPLTSFSVYSHVQKLAYTNGQYVWDQTATPPSATRNNLGGTDGTTLNNLVDIAIVTPSGTLGYAWGGTSPIGPWSAARFPAARLCSRCRISAGRSDPTPADAAANSGQLQRGGQVGYTTQGQVLLAYDVAGTDGTGYVVAQAVDTTTNIAEYHAFQVNFSDGSVIDLSNAQSWGKFASLTITKVAYHPSGFLVALNSDAEKVEILALPAQAYASISDAPYANQTGGEGTYTGLLKGSCSIAVTADGHTFLVMESANNRIQSFSVQGTCVNYFTDSEGQPTNVVPLPTVVR